MRKSKKSYHKRAHKQRVYRHVNKRAWQRWGLSLSPAVQDALARQIRRGRHNGVKLTHSKTLHLVSLNDMQIPVIYNKLIGMIVTVLPADDPNVTRYYGNITSNGGNTYDQT